jgi:hypothetical protein
MRGADGLAQPDRVRWTCPACGHGLVPFYRRRWRDWLRRTYWRGCVACAWEGPL